MEDVQWLQTNFSKVDCCVILFFPSKFGLKFAKVIFGQQFALMNANFACPLDLVVARRSALVVYRNVVNCFVRSLLRLGRVGSPSWLLWLWHCCVLWLWSCGCSWVCCAIFMLEL